jgi:hypothetical protein
MGQASCFLNCLVVAKTFGWGGKYEAAEGNYLKEAISDFGGKE